MVAPILWVWSVPSLAEPPARIALDYTRGQGAQSCPDESILRDALIARMKRDPFLPGAPTRLLVTLSRRDDAFQGALERRDADGLVLWSREPLSSEDCSELIQLISLSISVALGGPLVTPRPPPSPSPHRDIEPAPLPTTRAKPPDPSGPPAIEKPLPPVRPRERPVFRAGAGALVALGVAPAPAAGFVADIGVRWPIVSLSLEGRGTLPAGIDLERGGRASASVLTAALVPCLHRSVLIGCAIAQIGAFRGEIAPDTRSTFYAAAGARVGLEVPLLPHLTARITADLVGTLHPIVLDLDYNAVWTTPPLAGALGGGLLGTY